VKRWPLEFDHRVQPLVTELEGLRTMMANDMPKAAAHLAQVIKTLDAYANVKPPGIGNSANASDSKSSETGAAEMDSSVAPKKTP
jgi:hypothetical protein